MITYKLILIVLLLLIVQKKFRYIPYLPQYQMRNFFPNSLSEKRVSCYNHAQNQTGSVEVISGKLKSILSVRVVLCAGDCDAVSSWKWHYVNKQHKSQWGRA